MLKTLKSILEIQELDIKMIRLMRLKKQRQHELSQIDHLKRDLTEQYSLKEEEIKDLQQQVIASENKISELKAKHKQLEDQQGSITKVEEFNALTHAMTKVEREKISTEQQTSNILDKKTAEEEILITIQDSLKDSETSSIDLEKEIHSSISKINEEGKGLKTLRDGLALKADSHLLPIYERLLRNKKDRVIVPIENSTCSGCHITLTIQHENQVQAGGKIIFCEHCSRIHYWQESTIDEGASVTTKRRRRTISAS